jgi:cell division protein FtsB
MNTDILKTLQQLHIDFDSLPDNGVQDKVLLLINIVEQLAQENQELRETVRLLKDENNRLKGEQGRPIIRPKTGYQLKPGQEVNSKGYS